MVVEEKDLSKENQNGVTAKEPRTYSLESILLCPLAELSVPYVLP